jgi:hypothetical protein
VRENIIFYMFHTFYLRFSVNVLYLTMQQTLKINTLISQQTGLNLLPPAGLRLPALLSTRNVNY